MSNNYIYKAKESEFSIDLSTLENIASEFYGKIAEIPNGQSEIEIHFNSVQDMGEFLEIIKYYKK